MLPWANLAWPCLVLLFTIGFVLFVRWFGDYENKSEVVGADLNMVSFGFAADSLVRLMQEAPVLPRLEGPFNALTIVVFLAVSNGVLYMINLRVGRNIACALKTQNTPQPRRLKALSMVLGIMSALMFVVAQALWG